MKSIVRTFITILILGLVFNVSAQKIINVPKRVESKTINRINNKIDKGIDKGLDAVDKEVSGKNKTTDKNANTKTDPAKTDPKKTGNTESGTKPSGDSKGDTKEPQQALQSFSKYDFVSGDKVLFYEDFSQDAVGDFPDLWTTDVAGEVNTLNLAPGHWFNLNSTEGTYWFMNSIDIPQNFILEMDIVPKKTGGRFAADVVFFGESSHSEMDKNGDPGTCGVHIKIEKNIWETTGYKKGTNEKLSGSSTLNPVQEEKVNHVIVWVQGRRLRIYHMGSKVIDVPTNIYEGSKFSRICFKLYRGASCGSYISNIKITTAAPDMRSKLLTEGKLITYGIYFDVNKDVVKPESYGTLKGIADVLNENPELNVKIVGFTDSDGSDAANLDLSKRRGASIKNELIKSFGISASRLESDGLGEAQPVAPNNSPANKALNRRVEIIKL